MSKNLFSYELQQKNNFIKNYLKHKKQSHLVLMTKQGICKTVHKGQVDVDVEACAQTKCCGPKNTSCDFPVDIQLPIRPKVTITKTCSKFDKCNCKLTCSYNIHAEFECAPTITSCSPRICSLTFPFELELDAKAQCKADRKPCAETSSSTSSSSTTTKKYNSSCGCKKCVAKRG